MGQALYRKYRSKSLEKLVGQEHVTKTLAQAVKSGRISHAYLFTGPHGVGKTSVARILAHVINGLPYGDEAHLDIIEIDAASNRRIDDIRDLREKVHIAPIAATYKVYIIDEVHMLTGESFNALLKTLEEPPAHVVFILATTEAHKLPTTIISRTQRYSFRPVARQKVISHLKHIAAQEKIEISEAALELIAEHGEGSFRDSISLLDQLANVSSGKIDTGIVEQNLGLASKATVFSLTEALKNFDHQAVITLLSALEEQGMSVHAFLRQLICVLQAAAPAQLTFYQLIDDLLEVPRAYNPSVKLLTTLVSYTLQNSPKNPTPPSRTMPQAVEPLLEIVKEPTAETIAVPGAKQETPISPPLTELSLDTWAVVLAKIKVVSPPLYGVLRQAQPSFSPQNQTLTLTFKYQLHRKKADDSKAKSELAKVMLAVVGNSPTITTLIDMHASPPELAAVPPPLMDETAESVAALMGGGEPVHA